MAGEGPPSTALPQPAAGKPSITGPRFLLDTGLGHDQKIQIMTIRELLAGMKPDLLPLGRHEGFRRAPRERGRRAEQTGFNL